MRMTMIILGTMALFGCDSVKREGESLADPDPSGDVTVVSTFHSMSVYWSPADGGPDVPCQVRYRASGSSGWQTGYPLWFDERTHPSKDIDETPYDRPPPGYRGSLVNLQPDTRYVIELTLPSGQRGTAVSSTWAEDFPIGRIVELPEVMDQALVIESSDSGDANGYTLFRPASDQTKIDVAGAGSNIVIEDAHHVIVRGLTLRGAQRNGIKLKGSAHDVVLEGNDISGWGEVTDPDTGWGQNQDAAIQSRSNDLERLIIQRNRIHHPRSDANNWTENGHPQGPQGIALFQQSRGNHVIRYNEIFSDDDHRYNDCMGGGRNFSYTGFPGRDSDIYGNRLSDCWDDAIEAEGGGQNVRIWNNLVDDSYVMFAVASVSLGPLYLWRNVGARCRRDLSNWEDVGRGGFLKVKNLEPGGGRIFVFHNTMLQPRHPTRRSLRLGCMIGLGWGGAMDNVMSRNNILHTRHDWESGIYDRKGDPKGDYGHDLYNGNIVWRKDEPPSTSIRGTPVYVSDHTINLPGSLESGHIGRFQLAPRSPGHDDGQFLPNFGDGFQGEAPDIGAHEAGSAPMRFGVGPP